MTSKIPLSSKSPRGVSATATVAANVASRSATSVSLRSCGCARRFVPVLPQHSQSAPVLTRRRSRSSTRSSSSRSVVSSGRNTPVSCPSPSPAARPECGLKHRAKSESHIPDVAPFCDMPRTPVTQAIDQRPVYFSTTLFIRIGKDRKHSIEQVKYEMRYGPSISQEDHKTSCHQQGFRTEMEIQLEDHVPA